MIKNKRFLVNNNSFSISLNTTFSFYSTSTKSKQGLSVNNTKAYDLETVDFFYLNKDGFIVQSEKKQIKKIPGIYIYQNILYKNKIYIGSSIDVIKRLTQHKYSFNKSLKICPKFYNSVNKYGWKNFKVGILEYLDISVVNISTINRVFLRKSLLNREQYYFDKLKPTLNTNKIAGSTLGFKHSEETRISMGLQRRGKNILRQNIPYIVSEETRNNLSLRTRHGVIVKVLDKKNNVINTFNTIVSAAKFYDLDHNTISQYIKKESYFKNLRFIAQLKDVRV